MCTCMHLKRASNIGDREGFVSLTEYVIEQVNQHRESLIAEQAFRYEAILNPHLRKLGEVHKIALIVCVSCNYIYCYNYIMIPN